MTSLHGIACFYDVGYKRAIDKIRVTNYFYPARACALFRSEMYRMLSWNCMVLPGISLYRLVYLLPLNGITWYCIVLYCVVGFGARAVSRKAPIYFIYIMIRRELFQILTISTNIFFLIDWRDDD